MSDHATQLAAFMVDYERAANSHDVQQVLPLVADDATYWFTDGSYRGREEIAEALERTFATIHDEVYEIRELEWFALADEFAACRYRFFWRGVIDGQPSSGRGRAWTPASYFRSQMPTAAVCHRCHGAASSSAGRSGTRPSAGRRAFGCPRCSASLAPSAVG